MALACNRCGKSSQISGRRKLLRGHYNPTGKIRKYPNLQWVRLPNGKRIRACSNCRKTLLKQAVKL